MSQYGKSDYWDERYTRYFPYFYKLLEILNHSTGIKDSVELKIYLLQMCKNNKKYSMLEQEIPEWPRK